MHGFKGSFIWSASRICLHPSFTISNVGGRVWKSTLSNFQPVPLAYLLPTSLKPAFEFSTSSLGLLTTYYQPQASFRIFDQSPWPTYYLPASSQLSNFRPVPLAYLLPASLNPAFEFSTSSLGLLTTYEPQARISNPERFIFKPFSCT
jgi:hypothetical protein